MPGAPTCPPNSPNMTVFHVSPTHAEISQNERGNFNMKLKFTGEAKRLFDRFVPKPESRAEFIDMAEEMARSFNLEECKHIISINLDKLFKAINAFTQIPTVEGVRTIRMLNDANSVLVLRRAELERLQH